MENYSNVITVVASETLINYSSLKKQIEDLREALQNESEKTKKRDDIFSEDRMFINNVYSCYQNRMPFFCSELDNIINMCENESNIQISGQVINYYDIISIVMRHIQSRVESFVLSLTTNKDEFISEDIIRFIKDLCAKGKNITIAQEAFYIPLCSGVIESKRQELIRHEKDECEETIEKWDQILQSLSTIKTGAITF